MTVVDQVTLSSKIDEFLKAYEKADQLRLVQSPELMVRVSEVLGSAAFIYEKIRNAIAYKDEHLMRRNAIERILKRRWSQHPSGKQIAQHLIRELIWARYLENDSVPRSKVDRIGRIIEKYLYLRQKAIGLVKARNARQVFNEWNDWLLSVASCEIDKELVLFDATESLVKLMYKWMSQNFRWDDDGINQETKDVQLYIAIHRALVKSDWALLRFHLFNLYNPGWGEAGEAEWKKVAENLYPLKEIIESHLKFRMGIALYRHVSRYVPPFLILRDLVEEDPGKIRAKLADPEKLEWSVREICRLRYGEISQRLRRSVVRSIIYVFITKMLLAILLEVPYDLYLVGALNAGPLIANIIFPPTLMFLVGVTIRAPGEDNTERLFQRLSSIVYRRGKSNLIGFTLRQVKRDRFLNILFIFLYACFFLISFGAIIAMLTRFGFNLASGTMFIFFLCVVTFFGFRIRRRARELSVKAEGEGFISHVINVFSLPILNTGSWLSTGLAQINLFTYVMDFFIEAPFKTIIEVTEEWTSFMRQKREEIIENPTD